MYGSGDQPIRHWSSNPDDAGRFPWGTDNTNPGPHHHHYPPPQPFPPQSFPPPQPMYSAAELPPPGPGPVYGQRPLQPIPLQPIPNASELMPGSSYEADYLADKARREAVAAAQRDRERSSADREMDETMIAGFLNVDDVDTIVVIKKPEPYFTDEVLAEQRKFVKYVYGTSIQWPCQKLDNNHPDGFTFPKGCPRVKLIPKATKKLCKEGLYIADMPPCDKSSRKLLETRLQYRPYLDDAQSIYTSGDLKTAGDPIRRSLCRPSRPYDPLAPYLQLSVNRGSKIEPAADVIQRSGYRLIVDLADVTFSSHYLFSEEDDLATELRGVFRRYQERVDTNITDFYRQKLRTLSGRYRTLYHTNDPATPPTSPPSSDDDTSDGHDSDTVMTRSASRRQSEANSRRGSVHSRTSTHVLRRAATIVLRHMEERPFVTDTSFDADELQARHELLCQIRQVYKLFRRSLAEDLRLVAKMATLNRRLEVLRATRLPPFNSTRLALHVHEVPRRCKDRIHVPRVLRDWEELHEMDYQLRLRKFERAREQGAGDLDLDHSDGESDHSESDSESVHSDSSSFSAVSRHLSYISSANNRRHDRDHRDPDISDSEEDGRSDSESEDPSAPPTDRDEINTSLTEADFDRQRHEKNVRLELRLKRRQEKLMQRRERRASIAARREDRARARESRHEARKAERRRRAARGELYKPEKRPFNRELVREKIVEEFFEVERISQLPVYVAVLSSDQAITNINQCGKEEFLRRKQINKYEIYVKLIYNKRAIYTTTPLGLNEEFSAMIGEMMHINMVAYPRGLALELYESDVYDTLIDRVSLDSMVEEAGGASAMQTLAFHSAAPHPHSSSNRHLAGSIALRVFWSEDTDGFPRVPPRPRPLHMAPGNITAARDAPLANLEETQQLVTLDPNDPASADLAAYLETDKSRRKPDDGMIGTEQCRLTSLDFDLCAIPPTMKLTDDPKRYQVLQMRSVGDVRTGDPIPVHDKDLNPKMYAESERARAVMGDNTAIVSKYAKVLRFFDQVRLNIKKKRGMNVQSVSDVSQVVREPVLPWNFDFFNLAALAQLFEQYRPLCPKRDVVQIVNPNPQSCKLLIQINRGFNVPIRRRYYNKVYNFQPRVESQMTMAQQAIAGAAQRTASRGGVAGAADDDPADEEEARVLDALMDSVFPFVEVRFQGQIVRTRAVPGGSPQWNETLALEFTPPNKDFRPQTLESIAEVITISLFDEYAVHLASDPRDISTTLHTRLEKRYLGTIELPFSTVYQNTTVEGTLKVNTPPLNVAYSHIPAGAIDPRLPVQAQQDRNRKLPRNQTMLSVFATLDPKLCVAKSMDEVQSREDSDLLAHGDRWMAAAAAQVSKAAPSTSRVIRFTGADVEGNAVFITRYIRPQAPPPGVRSVDRVLRWVSQIPFLNDWTLFEGRGDLWCTSEQFLDIAAGDWEEHAILLCNYLKHADLLKAWVVLGDAIPEGKSAYVLTCDNDQKFFLWNASSGDVYSVLDPCCPMRNVGTVFDEFNIWANVQESGAPDKMSFDLSNTAHWMPFFDNELCPKSKFDLPSVQVRELYYPPTESAFASEVQLLVRSTLQAKIQDWRVRHLTTWNHSCAQVLESICRHLEAEKQGLYEQEFTQEDHRNMLRDYTQMFDFHGFPLNKTFTTIDAIVAAVRATDIFAIGDERTQFALAVYVEPFFNGVCSVWVYLAALCERRL